MTAATITRLRSGGAVLEVSGVTEVCPGWREAVAEASSRGLSWSITNGPGSAAPGGFAVPPCGEPVAGSNPTGSATP